MKKELLEQHIMKVISDQKLHAYFQASYHYTFGDYIRIGLGSGTISIFYVAVTNLGLHFIYIDGKDQVERVEYYPYGEIASFKSGGGFMQRPLKFTFGNGGEMKIKAQLKGLEAVPKYTDRIEATLHEKIGR